MGLKPAYQILANGEDITDKVAAGLENLTITDSAGHDSDSAEITINNAGDIPVPPTGAALQIYAGFAPLSSYFGEYTVDEVSLNYPPHSLTIMAKAADMTGSLKSARTYNWLPPGPIPGGQIPLQNIVNIIAIRHNLKPVISDTLKSVFYEAINQTDESDINLLTRLAKEQGAMAKVANGYLIVVPKGEAKSATQKAMPSATITLDDNIISYNFVISKRTAYGSVTAKYQDLDGAQIQTVTAGTGEPVHALKSTYKTKEQAQAKADAELKASQRGEIKADIELVGRIDLKAEGEITLVGFRKGLNQIFIIDKAVHIISGDGYITKITATLKASK